MDNIRELEFKYKNEIDNHIRKCLPNVYNSFADLKPSSNYEDSNLSFDMVFNMNFTVSVRIRKFKYILYNDLTIRSRSKNGNKTEIDKIKEGLAQVYFYAYESKNQDRLVKVRICDVEAIRKLILKKKYVSRSNNDGTEFIAFKFCDIANNNGGIYKYDEL